MNKRMDSLQAARAFACLFVLMNHSYVSELGPNGVSLFLVLSGFLLTVNYYERTPLSLKPADALRFAAGKVKKLYLLYILTMLPVLALDIYTLPAGAGREAWLFIAKELALSLLLLQSWFSEYAYAFNGAAWYLSTALFLYFIFPYILALIRRFRTRRAAFAAIALFYAVQIILGLASEKLIGDENGKLLIWFGYVFPPMRALDFAAGCFLGFLFLKRGGNESERTLFLMDSASVLLFIGTTYIFLERAGFLSGEGLRYTQLFLPFSLIFIYDFAVGKGFLPRIFTNKVTVFLGNISGFFYLIHQDVIRFTYMALDRLGWSLEQSKPVLFIFCGALSVALAVLYGRVTRRLSRSKSLPTQV